jgi:hypothetical protein
VGDAKSRFVRGGVYQNNMHKKVREVKFKQD